jgi:cobalt-precorrin-5B (C1)-methyltransferase
VNPAALAELAVLVPDGSDPAVAGRIALAPTALEALRIASSAGVPLGDLVAERARAVAQDVLGDAPVRVDVLAVARDGMVIGRALAR